MEFDRDSYASKQKGAPHIKTKKRKKGIKKEKLAVDKARKWCYKNNNVVNLLFIISFLSPFLFTNFTLFFL
jgi:hypothetical protein